MNACVKQSIENSLKNRLGGLVGQFKVTPPEKVHL